MRKNLLLDSHCVFAAKEINKTAAYYQKYLGFRAVPYLDAIEPHICLYRDNTEIILIDAKGREIKTNRALYGYGEDAYFITDQQEALYEEFQEAGVKIVRPIGLTDYNNKEFVIEDIDGRRICFGIKLG